MILPGHAGLRDGPEYAHWIDLCADDTQAIDRWLSELTLDDVREAIVSGHGSPHASWNHYFGGPKNVGTKGHSRSLLDAAGDAASAAMSAASAASSAASNAGLHLYSSRYDSSDRMLEIDLEPGQVPLGQVN